MKDLETEEFLAWMLQTTVKKVGKMKISKLQKAWKKAGLPPASIVMRDSDGVDITLFELGDVKKKKKAKKK